VIDTVGKMHKETSFNHETHEIREKGKDHDCVRVSLKEYVTDIYTVIVVGKQRAFRH
jgi:hypothetical protein